MPERKKLSDKEIREDLSEVKGWSLVDGKLHREIQFANFVEAFGFMSRVALVESPKWISRWQPALTRCSPDPRR